MNKWVIIPCAGSGQRFSQAIVKQYMIMHDKTVMEHTLLPFLERTDFKKIIIAIAQDDSFFYELPIAKHPLIEVVFGGKTRAQTVHNALLAIQSQAKADDWVLVHDAVRPCLHPQDLDLLIESLHGDEVGGLLASPVVDTLKFGESRVQHTVSRTHLWQALTPQMFRFKLLFDAIELCRSKGLTLTDEASIMEEAGFNPKLITAKYQNPKLTFEKDKDIIAFIIGQHHEATV